ncbi:alpha/beta fold hydrolase [Azospirillum sp. SYSU D00513]|uniref:alpha/beta hydrolase n=1 Tax=Azospirillum sp. SYSU D00513 TaxID=2812561 RepID=UPI001A960C73|nr:alpha/beta fold hydrolase [Azospirillum sp. SYSU D00513]
MPNLEILSRHPSGPARPVPLLFVHGAFSGAWIWEEKFLPWFAERGWEAHAVSLRGHGGSEGRDRLDGFGLSDFVEDVLETMGRLPAPPVLIGHSMGGIVVQRALARRAGPAGVLMASAPPYGLWQSTMGLAWRDPAVFQQMSMLMAFGSRCTDPRTLRRAMFSGAMPEEEAARYDRRLQEESRRILMEIGGWIPFPVLPPRGTPVLVLGAEKDLLFPAAEVAATARMLGTEPVFFPALGHAMMLETGWEEVARHIDGWLAARLLAQAA